MHNFGSKGNKQMKKPFYTLKQTLPFMYTDMVCPNGNEDEFCRTLKKVGFSTVIFLYDKTQNIPSEKAIQLIGKKHNLRTFKIQAKNLSEPHSNLRAEINNNNTKLIINFMPTAYKEFIHQRNSGLNHILCKEAAAKNKFLCISLSELLCTRGYRQALLFGRCIQNIRLAKKYKLGLIIASLARFPHQVRSIQDVISLFYLLGLNKSMARQALQRGIQELAKNP